MNQLHFTLLLHFSDKVELYFEVLCSAIENKVLGYSYYQFVVNINLSSFLLVLL
uniref:Uncharacterized protein n=1 Tax=Rhizophora mucronata TaxID=61149 RepID=A0A2P2N9W9_RHIMU